MPSIDPPHPESEEDRPTEHSEDTPPGEEQSEQDAFAAKARAFTLRQKERRRKRAWGVSSAPSAGEDAPTRDTALVPDDDVLDELEKLESGAKQEKHWLHSLLALFISIVLFVSLGLLRYTVQDILILIGVIFFHEIGHLIAMRAFGYADLKMFFIPLFGAAVSGQARDVSAQKRAIVSLMGPVPGLVAGLVCLALFRATGEKMLEQVGIVFLVLNAVNLLPFPPLDGGRFVFHVLLCRSPGLELAARLLTAVLFLLVGWATDIWILMILGGLGLLTARPFAKISALARRMRREGLRPAPVGTDGIPPETAARLIEAVRGDFSPLRKPKDIAVQVHAIWERIGTPAPGCLATVGLLAGYVLAFALLLVAPLAAGRDYGALSPSRIRATRYCKEANALVEEGKNEEAVQKYQKAIGLWPDCAQAHCGLGLMFMKKDDWVQAAGEFRAAIQLQPELTEAYLGLGSVLAIQGDIKGAESAFRKAAELKPELAETWLSLALLLTMEDLDDEAEKMCRKAIGLKPHLASAHEMLGRILERRGDLDGAVEEYTQLTLLDPSDGRGFRFLGRAVRKQGDRKRALALLTRAVALGEKNACSSRGLAHFELGDFGKAAADFEKRGDDAIWLYLARARAGQEARNVLLKHLESIEEDETPDPAIDLYLGRLTPDEYMEASAAEEEEQCVACFRLGQYYLIEKNRDKARDCFRKCVATDAKGVSVYYTARIELERLRDGSAAPP